MDILQTAPGGETGMSGPGGQLSGLEAGRARAGQREQGRNPSITIMEEEHQVQGSRGLGANLHFQAGFPRHLSPRPCRLAWPLDFIIISGRTGEG